MKRTVDQTFVPPHVRADRFEEPGVVDFAARLAQGRHGFPVPPVAIVWGSAGSGKTHALARLAEAAAGGGYRVLRPFIPRALHNDLELIDHLAWELQYARTVAGIAVTSSPARDRAFRPGSAQRSQRLADDLRRWADGRPAFLALDDIGLLGIEARERLCELALSMCDVPVVTVMTARTAIGGVPSRWDVDAGPRGVESIRRLEAQSLNVTLHPWPAGRIQVVAEQAWDCRVEPQTAMRLAELTSGNPAACVSLLEGWRAAGHVRIVDGTATVDDDADISLPRHHTVISGLETLAESSAQLAVDLAAGTPVSTTAPPSRTDGLRAVRPLLSAHIVSRPRSNVTHRVSGAPVEFLSPAVRQSVLAHLAPTLPTSSGRMVSAEHVAKDVRDAWASGAWDESLRRARAHRAFHRTTPGEVATALDVDAIAADILVARGEIGRARRWLDETASTTTTTDLPRAVAASSWLLWLNAPDRAGRVLRAALAEPRRLAAPSAASLLSPWRLRAQLRLIQASVEQGNRAQAEAAVTDLTRTAGSDDDGHALCVVAERYVSGRPAPSTAVETIRAGAPPFVLAMVCLLAADDSAFGRARLLEALAIFDELGALPWWVRTAARARQLKMTLPDGFDRHARRRRLALRGITDGVSHAELATLLSCSVKTAHRVVGELLSMTGSRTRVQLSMSSEALLADPEWASEYPRP